MKNQLRWLYTVYSFGWFCIVSNSIYAQNAIDQAAIDKKAQKFLDDHTGQWHDWNVPVEDGKVLYQLVLNHRFQNALEIGTSTGLSTIWIAWALSKTGGKLITLEVDPDRHRQALRNLKAAGLLDFVDARLGDAHELVKELSGPFDFVFSDADKFWYVQYFKDVDPKLKKGGCFTAHNVRENFSGIAEFMDYVNSRKDYETWIDKTSSSGISISFKK